MDSETKKRVDSEYWRLLGEFDKARDHLPYHIQSGFGKFKDGTEPIPSGKYALGTFKCVCDICTTLDECQRCTAVSEGFGKNCWTLEGPYRRKYSIENLFVKEALKELPYFQRDAESVIRDTIPRSQEIDFCTKSRPDMIWIFQAANAKKYAIHLEIDEDGNAHEDDDTRIASFQTVLGVDYHYLIRVNTKGCVYKIDGKYYPLPGFTRRVSEMCKYLFRAYTWMVNCRVPDSNTWKVKIGFPERRGQKRSFSSVSSSSPISVK
jgi:hypothetical protein